MSPFRLLTSRRWLWGKGNHIRESHYIEGDDFYLILQEEIWRVGVI